MIPHPKRKNLRLPTYDYSQSGMYFATICTHHRKNRLCEIKGGRVIKNDEGDIIQDTWNDLPERFPNIVLDEFTIMPNHIHGIIIIHDQEESVGAGQALPDKKGAASCAPTNNDHQKTPGLPDIIRVFKSISTIKVNRLLGKNGQLLWQRNYFEHVIRSERDLETIREYIYTNPQAWNEDSEFRSPT